MTMAWLWIFKNGYCDGDSGSYGDFDADGDGDVDAGAFRCGDVILPSLGLPQVDRYFLGWSARPVSNPTSPDKYFFLTITKCAAARTQSIQ